ncbi:MAG: hypothetical protein ACLR8Y_16620 [Alistipes indistinctus]
MIDQSGSMEEPTSLYGRTASKAEAVAATVNMLLGELLHRSRREEGYRDYFDIAVLGYHGERVEPLLSKGKRLVVKPSELYERDTPRRQVQRERRLPDGRTLFRWSNSGVDRAACRRTDADVCRAAACVRTGPGLVCGADHRECYPPAIFNITDGEASDSDEEGLSELAARAFAGRVPTTAMHC